MITIKEIVKYLDEKYPRHLRAVWDSTDGFLQGDLNRVVRKVVVSIELNCTIVDENPLFIILHHPPKFGKERKITNPFYSKLDKDTSIYVLHSRIDISGDINKALAQYFFESKVDKILEDGTAIIHLKKELKLDEVIKILKHKLKKNKLKVIEKKTKIKRIAIHGGEGFNQHHIDKAVQESIDLYLGGDLTHHLAESAFFHNVTFIDIEHVSEQIGMKTLTEELNKIFADCEFKYVETDSFWDLR
jgi:dinuclear metal center YbgI/SA1388 family protein